MRRDEIPVVLFTNDGRIEDKISGKLLPFVQTIRKEVGILDLPWSSILVLFTTGFSIPAIAALGIWGVTFIRSKRQAAGQKLLIDDATFDQLTQFVQSLADKQDKKPPTDTTAAPKK